MTDREMLELAAKAAGVPKEFAGSDAFMDGVLERWHPRQDDGDCARMEATLGIDVMWINDDDSVYAMTSKGSAISMCEFFSRHNDDKQAARRLASCRVAAQIGKSMP